MQYPTDVRVIRTMCAGRIDPSMIMEAFVRGADGVFTAGCLPGECHYTSGNFQADLRVKVLRTLLENAGLSADRLVFRWMSSAEGAKFVSYVTSFIEQIKGLGPLGQSEGVADGNLKVKLLAAKNAAEGRKLRWVLGKQTQFETEGNLYGEVFTPHEIERMFGEIVMDECAIQEIVLHLEEQALSVQELAKMVGISPPRTLRHLVNMRKMGMAELDGLDGRTPRWKRVAAREARVR